MNPDHKVLVDTFLGMIDDHLFREVPLKTNLRLLSVLTLPGAVEYVEEFYHLPITGSQSSLELNFPKFYITASTQEPPSSKEDNIELCLWIEKVLASRRTDLLEPFMHQYLQIFSPRLMYEQVLYAGLQDGGEFYKFLIGARTRFSSTLFEAILIGAGLTGDSILVEDLKNQMTTKYRFPVFYPLEAIDVMIFIGFLFGGHASLTNELWSKIQLNFDWGYLQAARHYEIETLNQPTMSFQYARIRFQSYDALELNPSTFIGGKLGPIIIGSLLTYGSDADLVHYSEFINHKVQAHFPSSASPQAIARYGVQCTNLDYLRRYAIKIRDARRLNEIAKLTPIT